MDFKYYANIEHLRELPQLDLSSVVNSSDKLDNVLSSWDIYMSDDTVRRYNYTDRVNGKKYQHRFGYELTLLVPGELTIDQLKIVSQSFMTQLLYKHKKVHWVCTVTKQGKGTYLQFYICLAKFYTSDKTIKVHYTSDVYRCSVTGRLAKKDSDTAVLTYKKGETKSVLNTKWSKKIRLFEMSKSEFTLSFIPLLKSYVLKALQKVKNIREKQYLKYLKHKIVSNNKKSFYYNKNVRYYNSFVTDANICLGYWNDAIYSPAGFYQDSQLISDWLAIRQRYQSITTNKKYKTKTSSSKELRLSLSPWLNSKDFQQNIELLKSKFSSEIEIFLNKHIYKQEGVLWG